jgi:hypothetical protein
MFTVGGILMLLVLCVCFTTGNESIGDEGVIRIAEGVEKNTSLKELECGRVFTPCSFFIHWCISHSFIFREYLL